MQYFTYCIFGRYLDFMHAIFKYDVYIADYQKKNDVYLAKQNRSNNFIFELELFNFQT